MIGELRAAVSDMRWRRRRLRREERHHLRRGTRLTRIGCPAETRHVAGTCCCHPRGGDRERGRWAPCTRSISKLRFVLLGACPDHLAWWDRLTAPRKDRYCRFVSPEAIVPSAVYGVEPDCGRHLSLGRWLRVGRCEEHEGQESADG